jgi:hypothetical protein
MRTMKPSRPVALAAPLVLSVILGPAGCGDGSDIEIVPIPPEEQHARPVDAARAETPKNIPMHGELPPGHPPIGPREGGGAGAGMGGASPHDQGMPPMGGGAAVATDGHPELPLKKAGLNSAEELARALAATKDETARRYLESGFRRAFTTHMPARDYAGAEADLRKVLEIDPDSAEAYRALAYAVFNRGFNYDGAIALYEKAIALKPDYPEVHYALAFMLGERDRKKGAEHFRKAMAAGVPDERNLRARYYADRD